MSGFLGTSGAASIHLPARPASRSDTCFARRSPFASLAWFQRRDNRATHCGPGGPSWLITLQGGQLSQSLPLVEIVREMPLELAVGSPVACFCNCAKVARSVLFFGRARR